MGSRAELLPEERAVGSDDPAAQAEAILAESRERTEHPDPDASSQSRHASSEEAARRGDPEGGTAAAPEPPWRARGPAPQRPARYRQ